MSARSPRFRAGAACLWLGAIGFLACTNPEEPVAPGSIQAAAGGGGGGIAVTAADPPFGHQGDVNKVVTITGSGFGPGAQASWQRNGAADPKITVLSTQYVSSTQLISTINIAADATIDFYDIAVTQPKRKGGIGTESAVGNDLFEVTQGTAIQGTTLAREANENDQIVGQGPSGAFFWSLSGGTESLASSGIGQDLSADGLTVVGTLGTDDASTKIAVVWTRSGGGWTQAVLPRDPAAANSNAKAVASDPATGEAKAIAGWDIYGAKKNMSGLDQARLWVRTGGIWQRIVLPSPGTLAPYTLALDVNPDLVAVGNAGQYAVVWEPNGGGGWTAVLIGPGQSDLQAINSAGTLTVGRNSNFAAYWERVGGAWTGPFMLPGACAYAKDVDDLGRIMMTGCPGLNSRSTAAVIAPPYGSSNITWLGGFGDKTSGASVEGMSKLGTWVVGGATLKSAKLGAYWRPF